MLDGNKCYKIMKVDWKMASGRPQGKELGGYQRKGNLD
jgi:hypothetical protein